MTTTEGAQAIYDNDASNLADYGRLYNWYAVIDSSGLCPVGWHVSSDADWITIEMELGMSEFEANSPFMRGTDQGTQMKSSPDDDPFLEGTNTSGFLGLAGGNRAPNGSFGGEGLYGFFWSGSAGQTNPWQRGLYDGYTTVYRYFYLPRDGISVRCVRD